ncbi:transmembrane 7 superfamily member 3-like [Amphiura filiformis]|uniref:transmembrane 7 superfamily member 3-like n=1 Tax=Amphiura filiformis TaxID=82378 RepID=UPI003B20DBFC
MKTKWCCWGLSTALITIYLQCGGVTSQNATCILVDDNIDLPFSEHKICHIPGNTSGITVVVKNVTMATQFATFQMHTRDKSLTGSLTRAPSTGTTMSSRSVGLDWIPTYAQDTMKVYVSSELKDGVPALFTALPYDAGINNSLAPVPGGCNQVFMLEDDPTLHINYDPGYQITTVLFAAANVGYPRGEFEPVCDVADSPRYRLEYDFYVRFLPLTDPSTSEVFTELKRMMTVEEIEKYGKKIKTFKHKDKPLITLMTYEGHGSIYNIIVKDPMSLHRKAAYVPVLSYACNMTPHHGYNNTDMHCQLSVTVDKGTILVYTFAALAGFVICYFGHRLFFLELFFFGALPFGFGFHMVFVANTSLSHIAISVLTALFGTIGGCAFMGSYWFFGREMPTMLLIALDTGLLFSTTLFFTPFGTLDVWHTTAAYGLTLMCGILIVPVVLILFPKWLFILSSAFWGSYMIIASFSYFLGGILQFIIINVVRRASVPGYEAAYLVTPFRVIDYTLVAMWPLLVLTGTLIQRKLVEGRPVMPPCPYKVRKNKRRPSSDEHDANTSPRRLEANENSSLLDNVIN